MTPDQWRRFRAAAKQVPGAGTLSPPPAALIIDSPWIPGWAGISTLDYFLDDEAWLAANLRFAREFPGITPFPSWWIEYGMGIEPSAFGARLHFFSDQPPQMTPLLRSIEDGAALAPVDPEHDGLMPFALARYRKLKSRIFDAGFTIPVVAARGPLCTAAFLRDVNTFLVDLVDSPASAHRFLSLCTDAVIAWLRAQADAIGPSVEGIFVLDDIAGFLSRPMYLEFAHPYLSRICAAFPKDWVKVYHNDANTRPFLADLPDTGFDALNFTHNLDIGMVREATGGRLCLMGNVDPLGIGVRGTPEEVRRAAHAVRAKMPGDGRGLILSFGGGTSPGTPAENIRALEPAVID